MPALARDFTVVAADQRGCGLSGKPPGGYDTATLAADLAEVMDVLGHQRFAVAGHADNVQSVVIPGSGHYCLEEAPQEMLATLTAFLAPYQDDPGGRNGLPAAQRGRQ